MIAPVTIETELPFPKNVCSKSLLVLSEGQKPRFEIAPNVCEAVR